METKHQFVMMPVPEELVSEVQYFVMSKRLRPSDGGTDPSVVGRLYDEADDDARTLLVRLADHTRHDDGDGLVVDELASEIGRTAYEALGMLHDLYMRCRSAGGPMSLLMLRLAPHGSQDTWVVSMTESVAELVEAAAVEHGVTRG